MASVVFVRRDGTRVPGSVRISTPGPDPRGDAQCAYWLKPVEKPNQVYAVDTLQALLLASSACAIAKAHDNEDFRVVHFSLQTNRVHLVVEADSARGVASGRKGYAPLRAGVRGLARRDGYRDDDQLLARPTGTRAIRRRRLEVRSRLHEGRGLLGRDPDHLQAVHVQRDRHHLDGERPPVRGRSPCGFLPVRRLDDGRRMRRLRRLPRVWRHRPGSAVGRLRPSPLTRHCAIDASQDKRSTHQSDVETLLKEAERGPVVESGAHASSDPCGRPWECLRGRLGRRQ